MTILPFLIAGIAAAAILLIFFGLVGGRRSTRSRPA